MEFVSLSITTHVYAIVALFFIICFNYLSVAKMTEFIPLAKRLRFMTPLFHMANAFVAYTGAIVAAYSHDLSITVILMIITSILVMVLEIKRYKKMRVIKSTELEKQQEFKVFAKKIYTIELLALMFTYVISKAF
jgi:magnesium-transporting ATPase (P-type)